MSSSSGDALPQTTLYHVSGSSRQYFGCGISVSSIRSDAPRPIHDIPQLRTEVRSFKFGTVDQGVLTSTVNLERCHIHCTQHPTKCSTCTHEVRKMGCRDLSGTTEILNLATAARGSLGAFHAGCNIRACDPPINSSIAVVFMTDLYRKFSLVHVQECPRVSQCRRQYP